MEKLRNLLKEEIIHGSLILFLMIGLFNLLNYVFQVLMAWKLGPADYGVLAVLMSFIYIFGIPNEAIQTIISKYTSKFNLKNNFGKMKDLMQKSLKKGFLFSSLIFIIFLPAAYLLSGFLKIDFWLIFLAGLFIFYVFCTPVIRGIIQGRKKFLGLGLNMALESFIKVIISFLLVFAGFKVYGAMAGLLAAGLIAFIIAFFNIKEVLSSRKEAENFHGVYLSNMPVLISITAIVLMYSLDIILAKKFFSPELAGEYAFVSMIGKTILFISLAVGKAMFPISSEKFEDGKKTNDLFKISIIIVSAISMIASLLCLLFPKLIIKIISLGSSQYLGAYNILFILALSYSFIALSNIIITYKLSVNKIKKSSFFLLFFALLQIILLSIFHSNIFEFSFSLLVVSFVMFLYSLFIAWK